MFHRHPDGPAFRTALSALLLAVLGACGGGGGGGADDGPGPPPAGGAYPLALAPGGRYLVDADGDPFLLHGDTAWLLVTELTREEVEAYLEDRRRKGFNAVLVELIEIANSTNAPANIYGDAPFLVPGDFSTPNDAYFDHAEWVVARAAAKGMLVLLTPAYMGFEGRADEGWYPQMVASGPDKLATYGRYLAQRFAAYDNILWIQGGDYNPPRRDLLRAIPNAIRGLEPRWLHTFHGGPETSALAYVDPAVDPWLQVNTVYSYESGLTGNLATEYQRGTMPFFMIESRYEGTGSATEVTVRRQAYQSYLGGAFGHVFGNRPLWPFEPGWEAALDSPGSRSMVHVRALVASVPWWTLEPDLDQQILIAGAGSGGDTAVAARTGNGATVLAYVPSLRDVSLDLSRLAGPRVRARWYDPADGSYSAVAGSPFEASGVRVFNRGGLNASGREDWALVLESVP